MDEEGDERRAKQFPNSPPVTVYFTNVYPLPLVVVAFGHCYVMLKPYVMSRSVTRILQNEGWAGLGCLAQRGLAAACCHRSRS